MRVSRRLLATLVIVAAGAQVMLGSATANFWSSGCNLTGLNQVFPVRPWVVLQNVAEAQWMMRVRTTQYVRPRIVSIFHLKRRV